MELKTVMRIVCIKSHQLTLFIIEYAVMVDNLAKAFERATERYLDQISSSDDEIAVEYPESESDSRTACKKRKPETASKRKPTLAAQTDKKRDRSVSEDSVGKTSDSVGSLEKVEKKVSGKTIKRGTKNNKPNNKKNIGKKKKGNQESKKSRKRDSPVISRSPSVDKWSSSPPPSWPPSSPEITKKTQNNSIYSSDEDLKSKNKGA